MAESIDQIEQHRAALTGHCYRMLGSIADADDAVQETVIRAWRGLDRFDGRSSLRTWLYRIATNVCLDALNDRGRRFLSLDEGPAGTIHDALEPRPRTHWVEPVPDARALPPDGDPAERAMLRQSIRLAFVAALQHLPPKQRAALLLTEVLGWSAAEVAASLETTVASVNSAVQRARATLAARDIAQQTTAPEAETKVLLERFVDAFHRYDVDELASLLCRDVAFSMPPYMLWLRGPEAVTGWLLGRGAGCAGSRLIPVAACGSPAFAHYHAAPDGGYSAWSILVLDVRPDGIASWTSFLDTETLFPKFGLESRLAKAVAQR